MSIVPSPAGTHWLCTDCGDLVGMIKDGGKAALVTFNDGYTDVTTIEDVTLDHVNRCPRRSRPAPPTPTDLLDNREVPGEREMMWMLRLLMGALIIIMIVFVGWIGVSIYYVINLLQGSPQ